MCKHCWDEYGPHHKDFIRGGVGVEDFDKEVNYRPKKKEKVKPPKMRGCPDNDYGPHVYIWAGSNIVYSWWSEYEDDFYERNGFYRREYKTCCGCGKVVGSRYSKEMAKLISKVGYYRANYPT